MKQVLSIEQTKHIRELGIVKNDTILCWCENLQDGTQELQINNSAAYSRSWIKATPAFTLDEVLELLPYRIKGEELCTKKRNLNGSTVWSVAYRDVFGQSLNTIFNENLIDAAYEMLIWCSKNGYLEVK